MKTLIDIFYYLKMFKSIKKKKNIYIYIMWIPDDYELYKSC